MVTLALLSHIAFILGGLLVYAVGTHTSGQRRHPSAALAWVLTIALLPYVGLPLYLLLGTRKFARPLHPNSGSAPRLQQLDNSLQACAFATLQGMGLAPAVAGRPSRFHHNGEEAWEALVGLINGARVQLDICTFVLGNDRLGQRVAALLQERAAAGVRVRLLLDSVGSWRTSRPLLRRLRAGGVEVSWYMPLLHNPMRGRLNLRNHRKLAIADSQRLWSGGRNLAAEYFSGEFAQQPWIDLTFSLEGTLAVQAQALFDSHWQHGRPPNTGNAELAAQAQAMLAPHTGAGADADADAEPSQQRAQLAQLIPSGPDQAEDTFYGLLLTLAYRAETRVLVVTPYFVPDDSLLTALCLAAQRGVQVELVVPARSNHRLADIARARALRDLVAAGGTVRLAPVMVHAKVVVVDEALAFCGSLNLDSRSLFLNFELMVAFYAEDDIAAITQWTDANFAGLTAHRPFQPSLLRDIAEGLVRWLGFQI